MKMHAIKDTATGKLARQRTGVVPLRDEVWHHRSLEEGEVDIQVDILEDVGRIPNIKKDQGGAIWARVTEETAEILKSHGVKAPKVHSQRFELESGVTTAYYVLVDNRQW